MTTSTSPRRSRLALLSILVLCYGVAALGALSTAPSIPTWYATLNKPSFNPPNYLFAPVWTTLYGIMAIAAWLIWRTPREGPTASRRLDGLMLFALQLALNALWTPIFFSLHNLLAAFIVIVLLWIAILLTTLRFWQLKPLAGALLLPYLAWVSFATALNLALLRLN